MAEWQIQRKIELKRIAVCKELHNTEIHPPTARTDTEYIEWRKQMGGYVPDEMNDSIVSRIVLETINNYFKKNLLLVS